MRFQDSVLGHGFVVVAVEAVTMIFWFAGFIAAANQLGGPTGGALFGSADAAIAFGAFDW